MSRSFCIALIAIGISWGVPTKAETAAAVVAGQLRSEVEGLTIAEALPVVVYLESVHADRSESVSEDTPLIRQAGARFDPAFLVVAVGQRIEMRNDDSIYHNVFSYSRPNDFDLGVYPEGESRFTTFETPGLVRLYCSIHDPMYGSIFVAPSSHFDLVNASGVFRIASVPAGAYRLRTWSAFLPEQQRAIRVSAGETLRLELHVEERLEEPSGAGANP